MKIKIPILFSFVWCLLLFPLAVIAQTDPVAAPVVVAKLNWVLIFIPVIVPLLIAVGKAIIPVIPPWILPIVAPALGALIDYITSVATGGHANPVLATALGAAGVGLREVIDQIKQRSNKPVTTV